VQQQSRALLYENISRDRCLSTVLLFVNVLHIPDTSGPVRSTKRKVINISRIQTQLESIAVLRQARLRLLAAVYAHPRHPVPCPNECRLDLACFQWAGRSAACSSLAVYCSQAWQTVAPTSAEGGVEWWSGSPFLATGS
jgi:hypothetical protein